MKPETENRKPITIDLFGVPISVTPMSEVLATITHWVTEGQGPSLRPELRSSTPRSLRLEEPRGDPHPLAFSPKIVTTPNPEMIVAAQKDPGLLSALQEADLAIPDGIGVVVAVRLLKGQETSLRPELRSSTPRSLRLEEPRGDKGQGPVKSDSSLSLQPLAFSLQRISGIELMEDLVRRAAQNSWRVMVVGGRPGIAAKAAEKLQSGKRKAFVPSSGRGAESGKGMKGSNLPSRFTLHATSGPQDILHASPRDLDRLITVINKIKPDLLFVAFGHGKQEKWMAQQRDRLDVGVMMGVGGALDQIVDPTLRPPAYIYSIGLGWLYRLIREPWRWKRQLALLTFSWLVMKTAFHRPRSVNRN